MDKNWKQKLETNLGALLAAYKKAPFAAVAKVFGLYTVEDVIPKTNPKNKSPQVRLRVNSIHGEKATSRKIIHVTTVADGNKADILDTIDEAMQRHGLKKADEAADVDIIYAKLADELSNLSLPFEKSAQPESKYFYITSLDIPTKPNHTIRVRILVRPVEDQVLCKTQYILIPLIIDMPLFTMDLPTAKILQAEVERILDSMGYTERDIEFARDTSKEIPKEWIDPEKIRALTLRGCHSIIVVNRSIKTRFPDIMFRLPITDPAEAGRVVELIKTEYLPKAFADKEKISIDSIKEFLALKAVNVKREQPKNKRVMRSDKRDVIANRASRAFLYTPHLTIPANSPFWNCIITVAPPRTLPIGSESVTAITIPLNVSDFDTAVHLAKLIQDMTEAVLISYFTQNPNKSILTFPYFVKNTNCQSRMVQKVKYQHDIGTPQEQRERFIAGIEINDLIGRPIDFCRMLMWDVEISPKDPEGPKKAQLIQIRPLTNLCQPLPVPPWDRPFVLEARTPKAALKFKTTIISSLIDRRETITSRLRGVELFGNPSTALVLRESLKTGLATKGISFDEGNHFLSALNSRTEGGVTKKTSSESSNNPRSRRNPPSQHQATRQ